MGLGLLGLIAHPPGFGFAELPETLANGGVLLRRRS